MNTSTRRFAAKAGLLFSLLWPAFGRATGPPPDFAWAHGTGGIVPVRFYGTAVDSNGCVYVTGFFNGSVTFGAYAMHPLNGLSNSLDLVLAKLDAAGNWLWASQAGNTNPAVTGVDVRPGAVVVDSQGNVVVTGSVNSFNTNLPSVVSFGTTNVAFNQDGRNYEVFVAKYSPTGDCLWAKNTGGQDDGYLPQVATDPSGNVYLGGGYWPNDDNAFVLLKLDADGHELHRIQPASGNLVGRGVAADAHGNAYLCGLLISNTVFDGITLSNRGKRLRPQARPRGPAGLGSGVHEHGQLFIRAESRSGFPNERPGHRHRDRHNGVRVSG